MNKKNERNAKERAVPQLSATVQRKKLLPNQNIKCMRKSKTLLEV